MMNNSNLAMFEEISNPLDSVEDFLSGHDWVFNRPCADELTVSVTGLAPDSSRTSGDGIFSAIAIEAPNPRPNPTASKHASERPIILLLQPRP